MKRYLRACWQDNTDSTVENYHHHSEVWHPNIASFDKIYVLLAYYVHSNFIMESLSFDKKSNVSLKSEFTDEKVQ